MRPHPGLAHRRDRQGTGTSTGSTATSTAWPASTTKCLKGREKGAASPSRSRTCPTGALTVFANGEVALTIVPIEAGKIFHVIPTIDAIRDELPTEGPLAAHVTGFPGITADYNGAIKDADFKLLGATVILVLFLLILVYRSPVLALVPLIVVGVAYMITTGIIYLLNQGVGLAVDSSSTSLLLVLMFGAGTDYCLLLVSRYGARAPAARSPHRKPFCDRRSPKPHRRWWRAA